MRENVKEIMARAIVLLCLSLLISLFFIEAALAVPSGDIEWGEPHVHLLHIGESVVRGDYVIEATDFFSNYALITIYDKDWNRLASNVTCTGEYVEWNNSINVSLLEVHTSIGNTSRLNVPVDQWIKIESRLVGVPRLTIALQSEKYLHTAGEEISINVSIRNYGTGRLKNARLVLNTDLTPVNGDKTEYDLYEIAADNTSEDNNLSKMINVRFKAPASIYNATYNITGVVTGEDLFGNLYRKEDTVHVKVLGSHRVEAHKYVRERAYIGEKVYVTLSVLNNGTVSLKNLTLTDALPKPLHPPPNYSLRWSFDLPPGAHKSISYPCIAKSPGAYVLPPAVLNWEFNNINYTLQTERPRVVLSGPSVSVVKTANRTKIPPNGRVKISLVATNTGDQAAIVRIEDHIPESVKLVSGDLYRSLIVYQNETKRHTYTLELPANGTITLPPALTSTTDLLQFYEDPGQLPYSRHNIRSRTNTIELIVEPLEISHEDGLMRTIVTPTPRPFVVEVKETPLPVPAKSGKTPGTGIVTAIFVFVAASSLTRKFKFK